MSSETSKSFEGELKKWAITCQPCGVLATNKTFVEAKKLANDHQKINDGQKHLVQLENRSSFKT